MTQISEESSTPISSLDRRCLLLGGLMTTFTTLCSFAWYAAQGTEWMRMLYRAGGNRSLAIMALIWVGLALFVGLVWVLYRRPHGL